MSLLTSFKNRIKTFTIDRHPNIFRPSSKPYLSGDSLRKYANFIFDETQSFNPNDVRENDIIFVKTDLKDIYFQHYHNKITSRYILITHNSDVSIEKDDLKYLDAKIKHWFAAKLNTHSNNQLSPMAYGLENQRYLKNGRIKIFKKVEKEVNIENKIEKIFCSFNTYTNPPEREPLMDLAKNNETLFSVKHFSNNYKYLTELSKYSFNLCPEGNNFESHRIWESLNFKVTPIVLNNIVNNNFFNLGIPLLLIDSWSDLKEMTIEDLNKLNSVNIGKDYQKFCRLDFWTKEIQKQIGQ